MREHENLIQWMCDTGCKLLVENDWVIESINIDLRRRGHPDRMQLPNHAKYLSADASIKSPTPFEQSLPADETMLCCGALVVVAFSLTLCPSSIEDSGIAGLACVFRSSGTAEEADCLFVESAFELDNVPVIGKDGCDILGKSGRVGGSGRCPICAGKLVLSSSVLISP